jgi:hypothetical protein
MKDEDNEKEVQSLGIIVQKLLSSNERPELRNSYEFPHVKSLLSYIRPASEGKISSRN